MLEKWKERLNPVFLKEARQLEKSNLFKITYALMVLWCGLISLLVSSSARSNDLSESIFAVVFASILLCCIFVMPAQILFSSNRRWNIDKTHFLQLTNLSAIQIVLGRLWSALSQMMVFIFAAVPFLALLFFLPGLSYQWVFIGVFTAIFASVVSISISLIVCWLHPNPIFQNLSGIFLLAINLGLCLMLFGIFVDGNNRLQWSDAFVAVGCVGYFAMLMSFSALLSAIVQLRHDEEDKSSPIRIFLLVSIILTALIAIAIRFLSKMESEGAMLFMTTGFLLLYPLQMILVTEPNAIGRRVYYDVKQGRRKKSLIWTPTGGNAVIFVTVLLLIYLATMGLFWDNTNSVQQGFFGLNTMCLMGYTSMLYLIPFLRKWMDSWRRRVLVALLSPLLFIILSIIPLTLDVFSGGRNFWSNLSPLYHIVEAFDRLRDGPRSILFGAFFAVMAFLLNLSRIVESNQVLSKIDEKTPKDMAR